MITQHYAAHIDALLTRYQTLLNQQGYAQAVVHAGSLVYRHHDDQAYPFKPYALAQQWLPFAVMPELMVVVPARGKPQLVFPARQDFWHLTPYLPSGEWQKPWLIDAVADPLPVLRALEGRTAWLGPDHPLRKRVSDEPNPTALINPLYYARAVKSKWEISCLSEASHCGVEGHLAARAAFHAGASEAQIHQAFLAASGQTAPDEPYPGIVGLNEAAATLHYERRQFSAPARHRTLLIDAGAQHCGYASDITRTSTQDTGLFAELLAQVDALQQTLCARAVAGVWFPDLHEAARRGIAGILQSTGLCRHDVAEQLEKGIPQVFFPHGLGHLLGLQVHDVGGHWQNADARVHAPPATAPALRLTRTLQPDMVITIEPGLYFIPMLLDRMERAIPNHGCDLALIESLKPFGGIRIEDNLVIGAEASRNLTREAMAKR